MHCFNRVGKLGLLTSQMRTYQLAQLSNLTDTVNGAGAQYNGEADLQAVLGNAYLGVLSGCEASGTLAAQMAALTVNRMVFRDQPVQNLNLQQQNTLACLREINRQMGLGPPPAATVLALTVAASATAFSAFNSNVGNGVINASVKRPQDGRVAENTFAEDLRFVCNGDSFTGGRVAGNETFGVTGEGAQPDVWAFDWPLGSNASVGLSVINGNADGSQGNLLTNSGFNEFDSNTPDNWELSGGAGSVFFKESTLVYDGAAALRWLGDGTTGAHLQQVFDNANGTALSLSPLTQYSFNSFWRRDGTVPATGVVTVSLVDADTNDIIEDAAGEANSFTIDLTALTTGYAFKAGAFRTPVELPDSYALRIKMTTGLETGRSVYLDKASLGGMARLYPSGPYAALHAGSIPFVSGDYSFLTMTNGRGPGGTLNTWQTLWARLFFGLVMPNELLLASSAAPNVLDSLIG